MAVAEDGIESIVSSSPASSSPEVRFEDLGLGPQILNAVADSGIHADQCARQPAGNDHVLPSAHGAGQRFEAEVDHGRDNAAGE